MLGWSKCCQQTTKVQGPRGRQSCRALEWRLLLPRESYGTACLPEASVHLCWSCYRLSLWESGSSAEQHLCGSVVGPGQVGRTTSPGPPVRGSCPPSFGWGLPQSPGWRGCVTQAMLCVLDVESTCILCRCGCLLPRGCLARQSQLGVPTLPESDPVAACWLGTQANQWSPVCWGSSHSVPLRHFSTQGRNRSVSDIGASPRGTGKPCVSSWPLLTQVHWLQQQRRLSSSLSSDSRDP